MNNTQKALINQDVCEQTTPNLGITQSSGLDRLSGYPDNRSVAVEVYRRKKGVAVGDELRNRRIAATILIDYNENGGTRP